MFLTIGCRICGRPPHRTTYNPRYYSFSGVNEAKTNKHAHNTVDSLKAAIVEAFASLNKDIAAKACGSFNACLEMIVAAGGSYIKKLCSMSCSQETDDDYPMNHGRRGDCIIFANRKFESQPKRDSAETDAKLCEKAFKKLGFKVTRHANLGNKELLHTLEQVRMNDHTECDALVVVFMSHGKSDNGHEFICTRDDFLPTSQLWEPFAPDQCPSLAGKPKIFFIQACPGNKLEKGVGLKVSTDSTTARPQTKSAAPLMADHLVMWASSEGYCAFRTSRYGKEKSVFIHFLTEALKTHGRRIPLTDILLKVSKDVAIEFQSRNKDVPKYHGNKQASTISSTLLRNIHFPELPKKRFC
ncbi:Caspase-like domain [Trinorchestia longiramus]|nr:Caspase-like domain [Trinorchestia longiramus]